MSSPALSITGLTRRFGDVVANNDITLTIEPGTVLGLLGHNGAGKTTLVSQVVGLLRPHAGSIHVGGVDAVADPAAARRAVAIQPQTQTPIDGLTPRNAVEITARLRGLSPAQARAASLTVAEELGYTPWLTRRALPEGGGLSGGIRRLVGFAMAAVAPTPLLVLDEPTNDVDAARRRLLWDAVRRRADAGAGVLLVTHNVVEAESIIDELVILDHGRVVASGSPARLRGEATGLRLELHLAPGSADPTSLGETAAAPATPPVPTTPLRTVRAGRRILLTIVPDAAAACVTWATALREEGVIETYAISPATLEDAYLALTSEDGAEDDEAAGPGRRAA
ncbi:ABC transporter ATP-binding protein [Actinomyces sp. HMT897]|uniref:ABC transporter ATP-binding protein n=1 Tax=Actinomyces sp. HMT897 TaxID=2789424 RepID=UPI00190CD75D|nr:ABC transporter ATP-binding protein [Actinomyces sp. HMT897]QQO77232.1 ABC transporter ATP-binding protein [Actinomyces sp. HMT897]